MDEKSLLKRFDELYLRSQVSNVVTYTEFLTPTEQELFLRQSGYRKSDCIFLSGGSNVNERKVAFFLPTYIDRKDFLPDEYICAICVTSKFSEHTHRDYLGSILGLGIKRGCIGDINVQDERAFFFCLSTVSEHILLNLDKVGRFGARCERVDLDQVPDLQNNVEEITFTVKTARLDAVVAGMFHWSRTAAGDAIGMGLVHLNYKICMKPDATINEGDIISVKGCGKGKVKGCSGISRKGRFILIAEILC